MTYWAGGGGIDQLGRDVNGGDDRTHLPDDVHHLVLVALRRTEVCRVMGSDWVVRIRKEGRVRGREEARKEGMKEGRERM